MRSTHVVTGLTRLLSAVLTAVLVACGGTSAVGSDPDNNAGGALDNPSTNPPVAGSAFEKFQEMPELSSLVLALRSGGVIHQTNGAGDYTFFAPTNEAFENWALRLGITVPELLDNNNLMYRTFKYHIFPGAKAAADMPFGLPIKTTLNDILKTENFSGTGVDLKIFDGFGRQTNTVQTDIAASNGMIHLVDNVLEYTDATVGSLLEGRADLTLAAKLAGVSGQIETFKFQSGDPIIDRTITFFAPNDTAFRAYFAEAGVSEEEFFNDGPLMARMINYHSRFTTTYLRQFPQATPVRMNNLVSVTVDRSNLGAPTVSDVRGRIANIVGRDTITKNGVVHVIDKVLISTPQ